MKEENLTELFCELSHFSFSYPSTSIAFIMINDQNDPFFISNYSIISKWKKTNQVKVRLNETCIIFKKRIYFNRKIIVLESLVMRMLKFSLIELKTILI